ncbi:phosphodiester glycosidase family protein, partial [Streptomyces sp. NPDC001940]
MNSRPFAVGAVLSVLAVVGGLAVPASSAPPSRPVGVLPLGPADLTETRTSQQLQPGVTLTRIVRGADAPALAWTVEVSI